jgi:hypothetical protein
MAPLPAESDDFRTDDELARAHQRGDAVAFAELVRRHEHRLRAFVFGEPQWADGGNRLLLHTWAAAERVLREGKYRGGNFRGWLFKVAEAVAAEHAGGSPSPRARRLATCFSRLQKANPKWHLIVMWVSHGLNRTAVARRHKVSKRGLKDRYTRAVGAVRKCLEKQTDAANDESNEGVAK